MRVATPEGEERVAMEAGRYGAIPQYGAHFERMGVTARATCIVGEADIVVPALQEYAAVLDETVVRALVGEESLDEYLAVLNDDSACDPLGWLHLRESRNARSGLCQRLSPGTSRRQPGRSTSGGQCALHGQ